MHCSSDEEKVARIAKELGAFSYVTADLSCTDAVDNSTPRNAQTLNDSEYREKVLAKIPAHYAGEAQDCAASALLLCSDEGRYITGTELIVDGGMHLWR